MTDVCALTYSQLALTITRWLPDAHACTLGSTNRCSVRSIEIRSRACCEGGVGVALDESAHEPVGEVGGGEERDLPQRVEPAVRQDARLQETSAGDHR